jgi:hypothetical protein
MGLCIFIIQGKRERERESIDCMHERHSCRLAKELSIFPVIL